MSTRRRTYGGDDMGLRSGRFIITSNTYNSNYTRGTFIHDVVTGQTVDVRETIGLSSNSGDSNAKSEIFILSYYNGIIYYSDSYHSAYSSTRTKPSVGSNIEGYMTNKQKNHMLTMDGDYLGYRYGILDNVTGRMGFVLYYSGTSYYAELDESNVITELIQLDTSNSNGLHLKPWIYSNGIIYGEPNAITYGLKMMKLDVETGVISTLTEAALAYTTF